MEESLLSWRSLSSETINNQQKWIYKIMSILMVIITICAVIGFYYLA